MHLLTWPKTRHLTDQFGNDWTAEVSPGALVLRQGAFAVTFTDPDQLRAFAMQVHAAAIDRDLEVQAAAAKASADRRLRRQQRGEPTGLRHRPFTEAPEPPIHMEVPA